MKIAEERMKFPIKDFFSKYIITEEILNGKLQFLCFSENKSNAVIGFTRVLGTLSNICNETFCNNILREKCPYSEFFWSAFSLIRPENGEIRIQSECGKMRTRITPNTDNFYAVIVNTF